MSLPGLVDNQSGKFLLSVVLPWRDVPVVNLLEKADESSGDHRQLSALFGAR